MSTATARIFLLALMASALSFAVFAAAPEPKPAPADEAVEREAPQPSDVLPDPTEAMAEAARGHRKSDDLIMHFGKDSYLPAGQRAASVIAIAGSASSDGDVSEGVLSVLGNTRVGGPTHNAVAVFGDTHVDSRVRDDAVAVFGNVELGPEAEVDGDVIAVGGVVKRDPAAIVHGGIREISFPVEIGHLDWLKPWLRHCLLLGRPLALEPGISWAWSLAFGFLGLYVLLALLFSGSVEKCVATLETRPGHSILASLLAIFLSPVLMAVLAITVVGVVLIPFAWVALLSAGVFGKVVILAALGRRLTRFIGAGPLSHVAFPVFVGGFMLIGLYLVPFFGFIVYKLTGLVGLGVVVYTLILTLKAYREQPAPSPLFATAGGPMIVMGDAPGSVGEPPLADARTADRIGDPVADSSPALLPRAGFWIRMAALLVDGLLVAVALSALQDSRDAWLIFLAGYGAVMWKLKGTTIGGILFNLKVARTDGREIDWATAIVRALSCFLSLSCVGLGFLWIVFDDNRQAWHDKIAGTVVVRVPRGISLV